MKLTIKEKIKNYIASTKESKELDILAIKMNLYKSAANGFAEKKFTVQELNNNNQLTKEEIVKQLEEWNKNRLNLTYENENIYINWGYFFDLKENSLLEELRKITYQETEVVKILEELELKLSAFVAGATNLLDVYGVELDLPKSFQSKVSDRHANLTNKIKNEGLEVEHSESLDKIFVLLNLK